ncbi:hypothetical protein D9611_003081 [Ephemerocybe angulata]|uniref:Reverse transcriptase domain-containing protein n=2 Tax=Ephemerocybe angulata TaxID=980116 RepID=A0A8H5CBC6_9AGAR|nr:hypothetical protein D9611_003081 [Tulosesus angulatus]
MVMIYCECGKGRLSVVSHCTRRRSPPSTKYTVFLCMTKGKSATRPRDSNGRFLPKPPLSPSPPNSPQSPSSTMPSAAEQLAAMEAKLEELAKLNDELAERIKIAEAPPPPDEESEEVRAVRLRLEALMKSVEANTSKLDNLNAGGGRPPTPAAPAVSPFVPPIGNGASSSLRSLFPDIEAAHITAVITHEMRGIDLHKLDSRYRDKEPNLVINTNGEWERSNKGARDYKSFDALFQPLVTYFDILCAHLPHQPSVAHGFFRFLIHFQKISREYEWNAVLEYTMLFHNRRRMEMSEDGDYSGWGRKDPDLMAEYVYAHKKQVVKSTSSTGGQAKAQSSRGAPTSVCRNWNEGKCTGTGKCPSSRAHGLGRTGRSPKSVASRPRRCPNETKAPTCNKPSVSSDLSSSLPHASLFPLQATPPARPNTDPRVNAPPAIPAASPTVSSTLNEKAWAHHLHDYPDPMFVDTIINIIRNGANLGFTGDKSSTQSCTNLKSAFDSASTTDALSADIAAQVANGRTRGPFAAPPFPNFRCSPLGAVSRKRSTKVRRIHHLSWPDGSSVNDGIPDAEASINYDMVDRAVSDLASSGRGSLMLKLDLESAFRHIPVRPEDHHLLGFVWEGQYYYDVVLGFGCRSAPYIFNLFGEGLHWIIRHSLPASIRHYLDDFLLTFQPGTPSHIVMAALEWVLALGKQLGLQFQPSKIEGPSTTLEFLGLELDSDQLEIRLPPPKLEYLIELLDAWAAMKTCTRTQLDELTGFLQFTSQVIPTSRAFLRNLYDFSKGFTSRFTQRRIPGAAKKDLDWWRTVAVGWNGIRFVSPSRDVVHIFTDAAGTKGLGGHFGRQWYAERCPRRYRHEHIQVKEMLAVVHAVLRWGDDLRRKHVVFHVDNNAVVSGLTKLTIDSLPTLKILKSLIALACRLDFSFSSLWLSSSDNAIADAASPVLKAPPTWWYDTQPKWSKNISFYLWHGLASSTRRTYSTGQKSFITYVQLNNLYNADGSILPASQHAIMSWIASLAGKVQPKTIKAYITHVRSLHVDSDIPFTACESPIVARLIRGIKVYHGERDRRPVQPITLPILTALLAKLQPDSKAGDASIYTACCVAYGGLLRSGEFTQGKGKDVSLGLQRQHVKFLPSFEDANHIILTLPASKTDPFRKGVTVTIAAAPGAPTCPVAALKRFWNAASDRLPSSPLFENPDGSALTYTHFVDSIRDALERAGLNPKLYAGHSFRRGAASAAAAAGYSDYEIQLLGRWRSDAYKLYIETNPQRILHLSSLLHMAHPHLTPFEPPALRGYMSLA